MLDWGSFSLLDKRGEVRSDSQKLHTLTANSCQLTKPLFFCLKKKRVKLHSSNKGIMVFSPLWKIFGGCRALTASIFDQMGDETASELSKPFLGCNSFPAVTVFMTVRLSELQHGQIAN